MIMSMKVGWLAVLEALGAAADLEATMVGWEVCGRVGTVVKGGGRGGGWEGKGGRAGRGEIKGRATERTKTHTAKRAKRESREASA